MYEKCDLRYGICVYCGETKPITDDHVPPKNIFSQPRPHNLITVPSCYKCNLGSSNDDEYFRLSLAMREDLFEHKDIQKIYPTVMRSLDKPNKVGFRNSF